MSDARQNEFYNWAKDTFGVAASGQRERALRFIEEAIELAQACGLHDRDVYLTLNRVFLRPPGSVPKEIGQTVLVLEGLAECYGVSAYTEGNKEMERIVAIPAEDWHKRQNAKADVGIAQRV